MKTSRAYIWLLTLALFTGSGMVLPNHAAGAAGAEFVRGRVLVIPKPEKMAELREVHREKGRRPIKRIPGVRNLEVVQLRAGEDEVEAIEDYKASGAVEFAEPDYILKASVVPNDPSFGSQWGLHNLGQNGGTADADMDGPEAWDIIREAPGVIVAIIDSGARVTHQDLQPNLWVNSAEIPANGRDDDNNGYVDDVHGIDSVSGSGQVFDNNGHGTHVAGIIGAAGNNGVGIAGAAWRVQLMPLRFLDSGGSGSTSDAVECFDYARRNGARVINCSFGSGSSAFAMQQAIQSARAAGIVVVVAAGNDSMNNDIVPTYPANYALDNIISVAATTSTDWLASFSNYGPATVDVGAPGESILSCGHTSDGSYVHMSGTSMAAPYVSGIMALMRVMYPTYTPAQVIQRMMATVDPRTALLGRSVSGGRVNMRAALTPEVSAGFSQSTSVGALPLTVAFTDESAGASLTYAWDFGDGTPVSTEPSPVHVFAREGRFTITLTVTSAQNVTSTRTASVTVFANYVAARVPFEWSNPFSMPPLTLSDNGVSAALTLPFSFRFYGEDHTSVRVGANGLIGFNPANMEATSNSDLPSTLTPNALILPYWDNLNPGAGGTVYAGTTGTAPNRRFVVSWVGVPRNSGSIYMTFQAALHENGRIRFNYLETNPQNTRGGGSRATIGIEDPTGTVATKWTYFGTPNRVNNQESIEFAPERPQTEIRLSASAAGGRLQLDFPELAGLAYLVEVSADLQTWEEASRGVVPVSGAVHFEEPFTAGATRFFRVSVQR